jgi:hypothetical protein
VTFGQLQWAFANACRISLDGKCVFRA